MIFRNFSDNLSFLESVPLSFLIDAKMKTQIIKYYFYVSNPNGSFFRTNNNWG